MMWQALFWGEEMLGNDYCPGSGEQECEREDSGGGVGSGRFSLGHRHEETREFSIWMWGGRRGGSRQREC